MFMYKVAKYVGVNELFEKQNVNLFTSQKFGTLIAYSLGQDKRELFKAE